MKWTVAALVGAGAGTVMWAVSRRTRRRAEPSGWATATDHVAPASV